jgi:hypothetical protein
VSKYLPTREQLWCIFFAVLAVVVAHQRDEARAQRDEARAALLTDAGQPVLTSICTVDVWEPRGEGATLRMLTVYDDGPCYTRHGAEGWTVCLRGEP